MENGAFNCQLRLACNNQETTRVQNLQSIHNGGEQCQGNGDITNGEDNIMEINGEDPCQQNGGITTGKDNVMDINRDGVNGIVEDEGLKVEAGAVIDAGDLSYRIIRLIGEGRCSEVYSAETINTQEPVAIKFFRPGAIYQEAAEREAAIFKLLNNSVPTAVFSLNAAQYKGNTCFVLELLDINIRQLISKNNRQGLPVWTCVKFATDILKFLSALHKLGYVHGDLKPGNIMFSGQEGCFKVFDFGLTYPTAVTDRRTHLHVTQSPGYRAPEVLRTNRAVQELNGAKRINNNNNNQLRADCNKNELLASADNQAPGTGTDVWAFGCLLYETIVGRKLIRPGDRMASVLRPSQLVELRFGELSEQFAQQGNFEIFLNLKDLIQQCLEEEPGARITAYAALQHPALTSTVPPPSRLDNILLPSPVIRFNFPPGTVLESATTIQFENRFRSFGRVLEVRWEAGSTLAVYVQFLRLKEAMKARQFLSSTNTRDLDLNFAHHQQELDQSSRGLGKPPTGGLEILTDGTEDLMASVDVVFLNQRQSLAEATSGSFTTEFFPLDLWYRNKTE